jgi:hypothetical protein
MAKKFGIKTGRYDATPARPLVILGQPPFDLVAEMLGMFIDFPGYIVWIV